MIHCFPNVIETKKTQFGGGGSQDGKWSHFPPFFVTLPFDKCVKNKTRTFEVCHILKYCRNIYKLYKELKNRKLNYIYIL